MDGDAQLVLGQLPTCPEHTAPVVVTHVGLIFGARHVFCISLLQSLPGALLFSSSHPLQSFTQAPSHPAAELPED